MKKTFKFLFSFIIVIIAFTISGASCFLAGLYFFSRGLPDHHELESYSPPLVSRIFTKDGRLLAEYYIEKRVFIPIESIPSKLIKAIISAEDKNFYQHPGIDISGIIRAAILDIMSLGTGKRPTGASTITQQVAKNFFLGSEVSLTRKIKEAILAFRIESALGKDKILELYLNQIYLGAGSYGVAAAAHAYFNKSLDDLTISESAYLAGLAKGANNYHPVRNAEAARARRDWVIKREYEDGIISYEEASAAIKEPLIMLPPEKREYAQADYFSEEIRRELIEKFSFNALYKEGLVIRSTLDPNLQIIAEQALYEGLKAYDKRHGWRGPLKHIDIKDWKNSLANIQNTAANDFQLAVVLSINKTDLKIGLINGETGLILKSELDWIKNSDKEIKPGDVIYVKKIDSQNNYSLEQNPAIDGAIVVIDPHTGCVLALQGGKNFSKSQYNRATQAFRQPGSAIKPFVYLSAMEEGITPAAIFEDAPIEIDLGPLLGIWKPKNHSGKFHGPLPLRQGLEKSINTITVRISQKIGLKKIASVTERFKIFDSMPMHQSVVLGSGETTLLKLTAAYAMLANGGKKITPSLIEVAYDKYGHALLKNDRRICNKHQSPLAPPILPDTREQVSDPMSVYQVVSMLEGAVQRGTASDAKILNVPLAGKTGTSNNSEDVWFIGFTPDLVVGVFVGFDHPKSLGEKEYGRTVALPIFINFMQRALSYYPSVPFKVPNDLRLRRINYNTGHSAKPEDKQDQIIYEAFKPEDDLELFENPETRNPKQTTLDDVQEQSIKEKPLENNLPSAPTGLY